MDAAIALSIVPVIVGLVVLALRLGLPLLYETPWPASSSPKPSSPTRCSVALPSG